MNPITHAFTMGMITGAAILVCSVVISYVAVDITAKLCTMFRAQ